MPIKSTLLLFVAVFVGLTTSPSYAGDVISCDSFESCPALPTDEILALEARIEALETLLAGTTRGIDPSTSQDTLIFDNSTSSETVVVRDLSTKQREGNLPVCFNGAGELLPCADGVEPPPTVDPYKGSWTGRMIYDRNSVAGGACYDADVQMVVILASNGAYYTDSITVRPDAGGLYISSLKTYVSDTGHTDGNIYDINGQSINFTLAFNTQGHAQGEWVYTNYDCYGDWTFTKD